MTGHLVALCSLLLALLQAPAIPPRGPLRLYAVGDINLGRRTARERLIEGDTLYSFRPLLDTLRGADITFGNLESPIAADSGQVDESGAVFTAPPIAALALAQAGFDIVSTANNHAWDGGEATLQETMRQLTRAGVLFVGSAFGRDMAEQPVIVRRGGWRIAFFAITRAWNPAPYTFYRHPGANYVAWGDTAWIYPAIRSLKESGRVDLVVVSVHGGREFVDAPPKYHQDLLYGWWTPARTWCSPITPTCCSRWSGTRASRSCNRSATSSSCRAVRGRGSRRSCASSCDPTSNCTCRRSPSGPAIRRPSPPARPPTAFAAGSAFLSPPQPIHDETHAGLPEAPARHPGAFRLRDRPRPRVA